MTEGSESINYLSTDDIFAIHELIVESNEDTAAGITNCRRRGGPGHPRTVRE